MNYELANNNESQYVWLIDKYSVIDDSFSLNWMPEDIDKDKCHIFNKINGNTGAIIKPIAALVPNSPKHRLSNKLHQRPASIEHNMFNIYVKIDRTKESRDRFKSFKYRWGNVKSIFITDENAMNRRIYQTATTDYIWIIDPHVVIDDTWDFNFNPSNATIIYEMPNGIKLYPINYFDELSDVKLSEIKVDLQ